LGPPGLWTPAPLGAPGAVSDRAYSPRFDGIAICSNPPPRARLLSRGDHPHRLKPMADNGLGVAAYA
jgi:hypothetical protein